MSPHVTTRHLRAKWQQAPRRAADLVDARRLAPRLNPRTFTLNTFAAAQDAVFGADDLEALSWNQTMPVTLLRCRPAVGRHHGGRWHLEQGNKLTYRSSLSAVPPFGSEQRQGVAS